MSQIRGKFIGADEIKGTDIRLDNDQNLRARNQAGNADVDVLKVNASDKILFASLPQAAGSASVNNDLVNKGFADSTYCLQSTLGQASGIATLDGSGKLPASQLTVQAMEYKGAHNVSTNSPALADGAGSTGDVYAISVGGTRDYGSGNIVLAVGDWLIYNGTIWEKVSNSSAVTSVNGFTGAVVLSTTDIAEGSNLYFTDERVDDRVAALVQNGTGISWTYNDGANTLTPAVSLSPFSTTDLAEGTNLYYTAARFNTAFSAKSTTDLAEGTNLYFTDERVDDRVNALLSVDAGLVKTYNDGANTLSLSAMKPKHQEITIDATMVTNQYFDLAFKGAADSFILMADGVQQRYGVDYLIDNSGAVTRIKFDNASVPSSDLKTGGAAALIDTDKVYINYWYF